MVCWKMTFYAHHTMKSDSLRKETGGGRFTKEKFSLCVSEHVK